MQVLNGGIDPVTRKLLSFADYILLGLVEPV